jgi:hypothetical protein
MTNADYYIDNHQGDWRLAGKPRLCDGRTILGPGHDCDRVINIGENYLRTGIYDEDGLSIILCEECAKQGVGNHDR